MALMFSILLASGLDNISSFLAKFETFSDTRLRLILITILTGGIIFALSKEGFDGELLARELKAPMPGQYHQLLEYMETKPQSSRIALLPVSYFFKLGFKFKIRVVI